MIEAHYTTENKTHRPRNVVVSAPTVLPKNQLFSDKNADQKMNTINQDIYQGTQKEKSKNGFNKSLYFKIFAGLALTVAGFACFRKIKNFFRKS